MRLVEKVLHHFSGRNAFKIILVIVAVHLTATIFYMNDNRIARRAEVRDEVIQKIVNVVNLIYATPVANRDHAITALTDPYLEAAITKTPAWPLQFNTVSYWQIAQALRRQLGLFSVSIQLEKDQWLNINATIYSHFIMTQLVFLVIEALIFSMIILSFWTVNRFTKPLRHFKKMAERLGIDPNSQLLPVDGPGVVKEASEAMNKMQLRIQELIRDRTQMLAAISHDLRTPITRMKLRATFIDDTDTSSCLLDDLGDMETMINETMAFARDDSASEQKAQVDLVSLVSSICDNMVDLGHSVVFKTRLQRLAFLGRRVALKRAFNNLIGNAVRYAEHVEVKLYRRHRTLILLINDDGPGIPIGELERVFAPFYRGEQSRSRDTGGVGLGLAVTRDIIKSHDGRVSLRNRRQGGLCALVEFRFT